MLKNEFKQCGIQRQQAEKDADILIVTTAVLKSKEFVIFGEDIDLFVLRAGFGQDHKNIFFCKPDAEIATADFFSQMHHFSMMQVLLYLSMH